MKPTSAPRADDHSRTAAPARLVFATQSADANVARPRVWLVGASTGIGRATAAALHARGARSWSRRATPARWTRFVRGTHPGQPGAVRAGRHRRRQSCAAAARAVLAQHGRIDLVVYCAGHYSAMRATAFDLDEAAAPRAGQLRRRAARAGRGAAAAAAARRRATSAWSAAWPATAACPRRWPTGPTKAALINLAETLYLDLHPRGHRRVA